MKLKTHITLGFFLVILVIILAAYSSINVIEETLGKNIIESSILGLKSHVFYILASSVVISFLIMIFVAYLIEKPIRKLSQQISDITKGNLNVKLSESNVEELQVLISALNRILASMKLAILRTGATKEELGLGEAIKAKEEAERQLEEQAQIYETILNALPQKVFLKDKNGVYISCNNAYAKDLKIKPSEITGKSDYDFYPKELAEKYQGDDKKVMNFGKIENIEERYVVGKKEMFVNTVKVPIKDEKGKSVKLLGIFWDITEKRRRALEVERFVKLSEGRELKMIELKKRISELEKQIKRKGRKK